MSDGPKDRCGHPWPESVKELAAAKPFVPSIYTIWSHYQGIDNASTGCFRSAERAVGLVANQKVLPWPLPSVPLAPAEGSMAAPLNCGVTPDDAFGMARCTEMQRGPRCVAPR